MPHPFLLTKICLNQVQSGPWRGGLVSCLWLEMKSSCSRVNIHRLFNRLTITLLQSWYRPVCMNIVVINIPHILKWFHVYIKCDIRSILQWHKGFIAGIIKSHITKDNQQNNINMHITKHDHCIRFSHHQSKKMLYYSLNLHDYSFCGLFTLVSVIFCSCLAYHLPCYCLH